MHGSITSFDGHFPPKTLLIAIKISKISFILNNKINDHNKLLCIKQFYFSNIIIMIIFYQLT